MPENIEQKRRESREEKKRKIRELGFTKEKAIDYLAKYFTIERLQEKIQALRSVRFIDPTSSVEIRFRDPISLIEKFPQIASYDINRVIQFLQSLGFTNPISLIEKFPPIAGRGINRVKRILELLKRLNAKFQLNLDPKKIIEDFPSYVSYDRKRLFFYLRIASFYNVDEKFCRDRLIKENPFIVFDTLYDLYLQNRISDKDEFKRLIYKIMKFPKEIKQTIQNKIKNNLPQIIEDLKQKQDDKNTKFLLKLASYLEDLLEKEREKKREKEKKRK